ncbi:PspC domain-containing protein [Kitasatospora sp. McL0602]|uniref:PspC domain-containing protein n=1 Tax=Kitasatospora sp. McL0602 TaxID=3439530 RepID=UPI003F8AD3B1
MTDDHFADADPAGPSAPAGRPPLTRSEQHRVVAGVCGGLGRHLDIDPVVFRVVTAVLCLSGGLGLFLYGLGWLIVPREPAEGRAGRTELQRVLTGRVDGQSIGAVLLTVIGMGVFFSSMDDGGQMFPLLLLGGLVFLAVRYDPERRRRVHGFRRHRPGGPYDRLTEDGQAGHDWPAWKEQFARDMKTEWEGAMTHVHEHMRRHGTGPEADHPADHPADTPPVGASGYLWDPRHPERNPYAGPTPPPPGAAAQPWWQRTDLPEGDPLRKPGPAAAESVTEFAPTPVARVRRHRSFLGPLGLLLAAGAGTLAWAVTSPLGSVRISTVLAAALLGLAVPLLVGAKFGRARGLTVPAVALTLALAGTAGSVVSHATISSAVGDRSWAPASVSQLQSEYNLGVGDLRLDLSTLDPAGATLPTTVRLGIGDARVTLPADVDVHLTVHNPIGDVHVPQNQWASGVDTNREYQLHPVNGQQSKGTIDLTVTVGIGNVRVEQAS